MSAEDVPDYRDVIAQPMDYATVSTKLKEGAYAQGGPLAFAADVRRIYPI